MGPVMEEGVISVRDEPSLTELNMVVNQGVGDRWIWKHDKGRTYSASNYI